MTSIHWVYSLSFCIILFLAENEAPVTKSTADEMSEKAKEQLTKIAKEMGMPVWALYCIGIGEFNLRDLLL